MTSKFSAKTGDYILAAQFKVKISVKRVTGKKPQQMITMVHIILLQQRWQLKKQQVMKLTLVILVNLTLLLLQYQELV